MPDYDLGTARGKIVIESGQAEAAFAKAAVGSETLNKKSTSAASSLLLVGGAMTAVGAAGLAGFGLAIKKAADFESQISKIGAVSGATEDQLEKVRKKALQLGADTVFSAGDAANAIEELVKAGLTVEDALNGAADATVALAAAGEIDLPQAATIAANAMNQFNLAAQDLPHVADLIAGAANASAIDVSDFGLSMQQAGATANLVGLSFDDLTLGIAALGNAGIRGSDAGTSLKTFLANLQPVTEKQITLFKELGLVTEDGANKFFDAQGKIKSLADISGTLQTALSGMTEQQKALTLETLFGSDAIRAAAIISNTGADGFNNLQTAIGKVKATDVAATKMDNLKGSIEQLKGSFETLLIVAGTPFLGFVRDLVDRITELVNKFAALSPETQRNIGIFGAAAAAALTFAGALITTVGFFKKFSIAAEALTPLLKFLFAPLLAALGAISTPVLIVIGIIAALVAIVVLLYIKVQVVRDFIDGLIDTIVRWGKAFWEAAQPILEGIIPALQELADIFVRDVVPALQTAVDAVIAFGEAAVEWFDKHVGPIITALGELFSALAVTATDAFGIMGNVLNVLLSIFKIVWPAIEALIKNAMNTIKIVVTTALFAIQVLWSAFGDNILAAILIVFNFIKTAVEAALRVIQGIIQIVTGIISGDWSKVWEGIQNVFGGVLSFIIGFATAILGQLLNVFDIVLDGINAAWQIAWNTLKAFVAGVLTTLINLIKGALDTVLNFFRQLPGNILGAIGNFAVLLLQKGIDLVNGLMGGIFRAYKQITDFFGRLPGVILDAVGDLGSLLIDAGKKLIGGLIKGITGAIGGVKDTLTGLTGKLTDWKGPEAVDKKILKPAGEWIIEGLIAGINGAIPGLRNTLQGLTGDISAMVNPTIAPIAGTGASGGGDTVINLNFSSTDPAAIDAATQQVVSSGVLQELTRAVRAGRRD